MNSPLFDSWAPLNPGVDVPVVQLLVEDQKELIFLNEGSHFLGFRPGGCLEVFLSQLWKGNLVQVSYFVAVAFLDHIPKVGEEFPDRIGDKASASAELAFEIPISVIAGSELVIFFKLK